MQYTDTELLDWIQKQNDKQTYTGKCIFRWSFNGRGWRLHETSRTDYTEASNCVRQAIINAMQMEKLYEHDQDVKN